MSVKSGPGLYRRAQQRKDMVLVAFADFEFEGLTSDDLATLQPAFQQNLYAGDLVEMAKLGLLDEGRRDGRLVRRFITEAGKVEADQARARLAADPIEIPPIVPAHRGTGVDWKVVAEELRERLHEVEVERDRLAERVHDLEAERAAAKVSRDEIRAFLRGES
jgi:signal transduction histidine kinase